jgi:hypothetical protein
LPCALIVLANASGCATFSGTWLTDSWFGAETAPDPTLSQPRVEERIEAELDDAIAGSLPDVSYESQNPAMTDPLGRADPSLILRKVETLDGEGRIVCRKQGHNVFGECVFPPLPAPEPVE